MHSECLRSNTVNRQHQSAIHAIFYLVSEMMEDDAISIQLPCAASEFFSFFNALIK